MFFWHEKIITIHCDIITDNLVSTFVNAITILIYYFLDLICLVRSEKNVEESSLKFPNPMSPCEGNGFSASQKNDNFYQIYFTCFTNYSADVVVYNVIRQKLVLK